MSEGIAEQLDELTEEARASGHKAPLRHAWASPPPGAEWDRAEWDAYWALYEKVQGLAGCAYSEAIHDKPGDDGRPPHRHRVYLAITERGTLVRTGHDYAKQEAVSRITEHDTGQAFTKGKHNKHAAAIVRSLGRKDVATAMEAGGLLSGPPAIAALSPAQRKQQERTSIRKADVARATMEAWKSSDGSAAFLAALQERGLWLAQGTKKDGVPVILDASGSAHGLRQMLGMAAREAGQPALRQAAIAAYLGGVVPPSLDEARVAQHLGGAKCEPVQNHEATQSPVISTSQLPEAAVATHDVPTQMAMNVQTSKARDLSGNDPGADGGGGGLSLSEETIDGPGEAPGPGESIQEVQRYRERLFAWEEKKGKAAERQQAALAAENERLSKKGATSHGHVSAQAQADTSIIAALGQARPVHHGPAQAWHGGDWHAHPGGDEGGPSDGPRSLGHTPGNADARRGRGWTPGRGEGAAAGDMHQGVEHRGQALRHRAALARATAALGSLDTTAMLDLLEPSRVAVRMLEAELGRIARSRSFWSRQGPLDRDPDAFGRAARAALWRPLHEAKDALPAAVERSRAASEARRWWLPTTREAARKAADALARAHAAVAAATPTGDALDRVEHEARLRAGAARDAHTAWQEGTGHALDQREHLLAGIWAAVDGGDGEMRRAVLDEGIPAAMRLQDRNEADREEREIKSAHPHEHDDKVTSLPGAGGPR